MKRRHFFQMVGLTTGGFILPGISKGNEPPIQTIANLKKVLRGKESEPVYWQLIRDQFSFDKGYNYFNTGGLGSLPMVVRKQVIKKMAESDARPTPSVQESEWQPVKNKMAKLLGAGVSADEIALIGSATEGINIILNGLPLKKGDEIITSTHEHVALNIPLLHKQKSTGIVPVYFTPNETDGEDNIKRIEALINNRTRLIFFSHVTTTTGQILPVKKIGCLAKERGLLYALDGAQAVGQIPVDLKDIGADFYTFSGHKWLLGPTRTGILYVRKDKLDQLKPTTVGAHSDSKKSNIDAGKLVLNETAQRYEFGTQNKSLFSGLETAVEFVNTIGIDRIHRHNIKLTHRFLEGLQLFPKAEVEILSPIQQVYRSGIITFRLKHTKSQQVCTECERNGFRLRGVGESGLNAVRVSFHLFNCESQVDRLLEFLRSLNGKPSQN